MRQPNTNTLRGLNCKRGERIVTPEMLRKVKELREYGLSFAAIGLRFGVDQATIRARLREAKELQK